MLIGEAPGADEDRVGKPFVGQAGQLLDKMFDCINLNRKKNFYITNLVFWRPPGNRNPNKQEISTCLPLTKKHISIINPKLLILAWKCCITINFIIKRRNKCFKKKRKLFYRQRFKFKNTSKSNFSSCIPSKKPCRKKNNVE